MEVVVWVWVAHLSPSGRRVGRYTFTRRTLWRTVRAGHVYVFVTSSINRATWTSARTVGGFDQSEFFFSRTSRPVGFWQGLEQLFVLYGHFAMGSGGGVGGTRYHCGMDLGTHASPQCRDGARLVFTDQTEIVGTQKSRSAERCSGSRMDGQLRPTPPCD